MGEVIGGVVSLGLGVAVSPLPIVAVFMILASSRATTGLWFLVGRVLALVVITALLAPFADAIDDAAGSTTPAAIARLALGVGLLVWGAVSLLTRPRVAQPAELPLWMRAIEALSGAGAFRIGFLVTVVNLKEVALTAAAGLMIGGAMLDAGSMIVAGAVFLAVATASVVLPLLARILLGDRITPTLTTVRDRLVRHNATIVAVVLLVIGILLIVSSGPALLWGD